MNSLSQFALDFARLCLWLIVLAAVFVPLERLFGLHRSQSRRVGIANDTVYYFLSSLLPAALLAAPLSLIATVVHSVAPPGWIGWAGALPLWARLALTLVVGEIGAYWGHRWSHQVPLLWRFHSLHHSARQMDWLVHTRAHPVDMVFVRLCGLVPAFALGLAQPSGAGATLAAVSNIATAFWGFAIHANLRWRFGLVEQLVSTPAFHHWHHSRRDHINRNYAAMFPWIDRLFGTFHLGASWPSAYGIDTPTPTRLHQQLIEPLLRPRHVAQARPVEPESPVPEATSR